MVRNLDRFGRSVLVVSVLVAVILLAATGAVAAQSAPDCSTVTYNGDGTEANPYEVSNVDQLQCIKSQGLSANYTLISDIDASGTSSWNVGNGFDPIGELNFSRETKFNGRFDGGGHNISDLTINRNKEGVIGLFGAVGSAGDIMDISVVNASINGSNFVGGLVGDNAGTLNEAHVTGAVNGDNEVGGLVGENGGEGKISESHATGSVDGDEFVGGLVGSNFGDIYDSYATAQVNADSGFVGGLVGSNSALVSVRGREIFGTVESSYATGSVDGSGFVGGLAGNNNGVINDSYANGSVKGFSDRVGDSKEVGGLVGENSGPINQSYAAGSVSGSERVGSLVGENFDLISDSYATGSVNGDEFVGGLVGFNAEGAVQNSFASGNATGEERYTGGLAGINDGKLNDSSASGNVKGSQIVGGLVGENKDGGTVQSSSASGNVTGDFNIGGLVGENDDGGTVRSSSASGKVEGDRGVGGLVGENSKSEVSDSSASGIVTANETVGGLIGENGGMVEDSYARGVVEGSENDIGGLVGRNGRSFSSGSIERSYATGRVTGIGSIPTVGGLVGNNSAGTVTDSYWDTQSTGQPTSDGGTGLTTSEMTGSAATSNLIGFDFTDTWETVTSPDDYPILQWQDFPPAASFTLSTNNPTVGEAVTFDASASSDRDGTVQTYEWDFDGDGTTDVTRSTPLVTHTYDTLGEYAVMLTVTDDDGATNSTVKTVEVRDPSTSPVDGVSDALWNAVTQDDGSDGLSLADLGNAIQEYQKNPSGATVDGVSIGLSDLGSLIQYYRTEVV